jgi:hypothetical protein
VARVCARATQRLCVTFFGASAMRLDTVGTVLEKACLCVGEERDQVARLVLRDLPAALDWLLARATAFVDLHPGNVILVGAGTARRAYLIDAESCSALGVQTDAPIRPAFRTLGADKTPSAVTDRRGLLLVLAWVLDVDRFRSGVARLESREAGEAEARELCWRYASLEAFVEVHLKDERESEGGTKNGGLKGSLKNEHTLVHPSHLRVTAAASNVAHNVRGQFFFRIAVVVVRERRRLRG